jgi:hypothetical protein
MAIPAILVPVILWAVKALSKEARELLAEALGAWYVKALATPNKVDDIAAAIICKLLQVDTSGVVPGPDNLPGELVDAVVGGMTEIATGNPFDPPGYRPGIDSP